jgi:xanthine dehydrogenase accessory factor
MMHSTERQVLDTMCAWAAEGYRFILATVAHTWGSAPRRAGSMMAIREDGQVQGSVSGGCIEQDLIARFLNGTFNGTTPFLAHYGVSKEDAYRFGLPCGGKMELLIEPAPDVMMLRDIASRISMGQLVRRVVTAGVEGNATEAGAAGDIVQWEDGTLRVTHGPAWRLLIIGAGQTSTYLAQMAQALDYQIVVCDPRTEYSNGWTIPNTTLLTTMPDDAVIELNLDPHSAVVALTHDPKLDDMALLEALKSPAFYVGALGSFANNTRRRERLLQHFDLTQEEVDRLHGPVGLPIGSRTPPEIAISILAEMTAVRNRAWFKTVRASKQAVLTSYSKA